MITIWNFGTLTLTGWGCNFQCLTTLQQKDTGLFGKDLDPFCNQKQTSHAQGEASLWNLTWDEMLWQLLPPLRCWNQLNDHDFGILAGLRMNSKLPSHLWLTFPPSSFCYNSLSWITFLEYHVLLIQPTKKKPTWWRFDDQNNWLSFWTLWGESPGHQQYEKPLFWAFIEVFWIFDKDVESTSWGYLLLFIENTELRRPWTIWHEQSPVFKFIHCAVQLCIQCKLPR